MSINEQKTNSLSLLTEKEASEILKIPMNTLRRWRWSGDGPNFLKLGSRCVRYDLAELNAWLNKGRKTSTSDNGEGYNKCIGLDRKNSFSSLML